MEVLGVQSRVGLMLVTGLTVCGQIATDGTLGAAVKLAGPDLRISESLGRSVGGNLFHSFSTFNVGTKESVAFEAGPNVEHVIARVTGGFESNINGRLHSDADLLLVNPAGVVFGPDAKVDVTGAFTVSTADYVKVGGTGRFDAADPRRDVLSIAPVSGFGFLPGNASGGEGSIRFEGSQPDLPPGVSLVVVGGNVVVDDKAILLVTDGNLEIGAFGGAGEVAYPELRAVTGTPTGDITIRGDSVVGLAADHDQNRTATLRAQNLEIIGDNTDQIPTTILFSVSRGEHSSASLDIQMDGLVSTQSEGLIYSQAVGGSRSPINIGASEVTLRSGGIQSEAYENGRAGDITIHVPAGKLTVSDGAAIRSMSFDDANSGDIFVNAGRLEIAKGTIDSSTWFEGMGNAGAINIEVAGAFNLVAGGIWATGNGGRNGGNVAITAESILLDGANIRTESLESGIPSEGPGVAGKSGDINVRAGELRLQNAAALDSGTAGRAAGGAIEIRADRVTLSGRSKVVSDSTSAAPEAGAAGNISIYPRNEALMVEVTEPAEVSNGSSITAEATGGNAGNISIQASSIGLEGKVSIGVETHGTGPAGNITLQAPRIILTERASVSTSVKLLGGNGSGTAGRIEIGADQLFISKRAAVSATGNGFGSGGSIRVTANEIEVSSGGKLDASASGSSKAGDIQLRANQLLMDGTMESTLISTASLGGSGDAGTIDICAARIEILGKGTISTQTAGVGTGGSIAIHSEAIVIDGRGAAGNGIRSGPSDPKFGGGSGGPIDLSPQGDKLSVSIIDRGEINSTTMGTGRGGDITVRATDLIIASGGSISSKTGDVGHGGNVRATADRIQISGAGSTIATSSVGLDETGGKAGNIELQGRLLFLESGAVVSSSSEHRADAGSITLTATDALTLTGQSRVSVRSIEGNAGTIRMESNRRIRLQDATVSAEALLAGGNFSAEAESFGLERSRIHANAELGAGGNIRIRSDLFYVIGPKDIRYDSQNTQARAGSFILELNPDLNAILEMLLPSFVEDEQQIQEGCSRRNPRGSSLIFRGKGGVSAMPDSLLASPIIFPL